VKLTLFRGAQPPVLPGSGSDRLAYGVSSAKSLQVPDWPWVRAHPSVLELEPWSHHERRNRSGHQGYPGGRPDPNDL